MNSDPLFRAWIEANVGEIAEEVCGLFVAKDTSKIPELFDKAFARYEPIVLIGKRKFKGANILNSAKTKEDLIAHANLIAPVFSEFLKAFTSHDPLIFASSGPNNEQLIKSGDGLYNRLIWKEPEKVHDMLRCTVVCPTITSFDSSIRRFITYCEENGKDISIYNVYDNVHKFGAEDRIDPTIAFGYVGVHISVPFTVMVPIVATDETGCTTSSMQSITLVAEVQFHPISIYDGTSSCLKELHHHVYRYFRSGEAIKKNPEEASKLRTAVEMYYAYAMESVPE